MSTTSQKHHNFVSEPMGDKPVTDLAGIGETLGKRLDAKGFDKVEYSNLIIVNYNVINFHVIIHRPTWSLDNFWY